MVEILTFILTLTEIVDNIGEGGGLHQMEVVCLNVWSNESLCLK